MHGEEAYKSPGEVPLIERYVSKLLIALKTRIVNGKLTSRAHLAH